MFLITTAECRYLGLGGRPPGYSLARSPTLGFRLVPAHGLQVQQVHVVEEAVHVPAPEDQHLVVVDDRARVAEAGAGRPAALGALEPGHGHRVEGVDVLEHQVLLPLSPENDHPRARQNRRVAVPSIRRNPQDLRFLWLGGLGEGALGPIGAYNPFVVVDVQHVGVVQVGEALFLPRVVVAPKNDDDPAYFGRSVPAPDRRGDSLDQWRGPLVLFLGHQVFPCDRARV